MEVECEGLSLLLSSKKIENDTGKRIADHFHMIVGTSTGGILASALVQRNPTAKLLEIYQKRGTEIFPKLFNVLNTSVIHSKYNTKGLEKIFEELFGDTKLSDLDPNGPALLVPTYDIDKGLPYFFKSSKLFDDKDTDKNKFKDYNFKLRDVTLATSSAPTYYPPAHIKNEMGKEHWFVDGGVFANNPSVCAVAAALSVYKKLSPKNILVVSLGTGVTTTDSIVSTVKDGGSIEWGMKIMNLLFNGAATVQDHQMKCFLSEGKNYFRFQVDLDTKEKMDNTSKEFLVMLETKVKNAMEGNEGCEGSEGRGPGKWTEYYHQIIDILKTPRMPWEELDVYREYE